ncbi:hypothetical protein PanWU01x14_165160 [Parasponia andersonii]|uniref:Uncharacterized protein n=1 Tax=Parasponia andersonii TaxID=3476 RepID=A0A2P5CC38_PARAD|nr:hypothetical protein PanWU01x14_165160 [Parasponia andersonii]
MVENVDKTCMRSVNKDFENIVGKSTFGDIMFSMNVQTRSVLEGKSGFENIGDVTVVESREVGGSSLISRGRTKVLSWNRALDLVLMNVDDEILMDEQNKESLDVDIMTDSSAEEHLTLFGERPDRKDIDVLSHKSQWNDWIGLLFQCEKIFMPLLVKRHRILVIIDIRESAAFVCDNL